MDSDKPNTDSDSQKDGNNLEKSNKAVVDTPLVPLDKVRPTSTPSSLDVSQSPKLTAQSFGEYAKAKLENAFFSGTYEDRVYVESLGGYRDRVIVDQDEHGFIKSLKTVLKRGKKLQGEQFQGIKSKSNKLICTIMEIFHILLVPI